MTPTTVVRKPPHGTVHNGLIYNQSPSAAPDPKVFNSTVAGAVTAIILWAIGYFAQVAIPAEIGAAVTVIVTFAMGYVTPPAGFNGPDPMVGTVVTPAPEEPPPPPNPAPQRGGW